MILLVLDNESSICRETLVLYIYLDRKIDILCITYLCSIDGEYVPQAGDLVLYKTTLIPPKMEKVQAVHVRIIQPVEGVVHETWDQPT